MTEESTEERIRREALQLQLRTSLGRAYAFVHSRSRVEQTLVRSVDDWSLAALEKIEGSDTIQRTNRNLTEIERVEEVRQGIRGAISVIRSHSEI